MAPHWQYLHWVVYVSAVVGAWRYVPLAIVRSVAAFTRDDQRHRQCMEVLRLARKDASSIPTYLTGRKRVAPPSPAQSSERG
jgi:hypothetical protein